MYIHREFHSVTSGSRLNWLRAAVLGANDGIVSVSSIVVGVAGASNSSGFIFTAGLAGLVAGALSMAVGEYISVSTQRDSERALLKKERRELETSPEAELEELTMLYEAKGLKKETAHIVAKELTEHDVFAAHVDAELRIDPHNLTNPLQAALASSASFLSGAIIPLIAIIFAPEPERIYFVFGSALLALIITGALSAQAGGANRVRATVRVVLGGIFAMIVTLAIGVMFGNIGI